MSSGDPTPKRWTPVALLGSVVVLCGCQSPPSQALNSSMPPSQVSAVLHDQIAIGMPYDRAFAALRDIGLEPVYRPGDPDEAAEPVFTVTILHRDDQADADRLRDARLLIYLGKGAIVRKVLLEPAPTWSETDGVWMAEPVPLLESNP